MTVWEKDGCGTSTKWIRRVMEDFRSEGTRNMKSTDLLKNWIEKVDRTGLKEMFTMDSEATLEILVNCFGTQKAFWKFQEIVIESVPEEHGSSLKLYEKHLKEKCGWLDRDQITEINERYCKKIRILENEIEQQQQGIEQQQLRTKETLENEVEQQRQKTRAAVEQADRLDEENIKLKNQIIYLKARLFDAYEAGFDPDQIIHPDTIEE